MFKMFNVGFGESILLSDNSKCLLVDCGSESNENKNFKKILEELNSYEKRSAVITHFHDDHINGFIYMIDKQKNLFDTIYIPNIFSTKISIFNNMQGFSIVDLEIVKYILENKHCNRKSSLSILDLLKALVKSTSNIKVAERGLTFNEIDNGFTVLWPNPKYLISEKIIHDFHKKLSFDAAILNYIHSIGKEIVGIFNNLITREINSGSKNIDSNLDTTISQIEQRLITLLDLASQEFSYEKGIVDSWIKRIKLIENNTSIVFQSNFNDNSILLTGDIENSIMKKICENKYEPSVKIFEEYKLIKAPHHGTDSNHFLKFDVYTKFENIAISNGETNRSKRGKISINYTSKCNNYKIYCTNSLGNRCQYCSEHTNCCGNADLCNCEKNIGDINVF